jgi:hypothetical protein
MKKLIRNIFIGIIILLGTAAAAGLWYTQKVFLPKKLKPLLIETAGSKGIRIDLESISYRFPEQFSIANLTIFEKDIPDQKLITAKELTIRFKPLRALLKKQIFIDRVVVKALQVYPGPGHTFISKGDASLDGELSFTLNKASNLFYNAVLTLEEQDIKNMPLVKDIAGLSGQIKIEIDKISIIKLKGASFGCPVEFAGYLENFKDPYLDLTETIDLDLSKINSFLSARINKAIKHMVFWGKSAVVLNMSGKFSEWPLKFNGHAAVIDAGVKIEPLASPINGINGEVDFNENSLTIPQLQAQYNQKAYTFKANVTDFTTPCVYAVLNSQDLLLEIKMKTAEDYTHFESIDGTWFNSTINLVGDIQNYQDPRIKLSGEAKVDLKDIQRILPRILGENKNITALLDNIAPGGICNAAIFADGLVKDFSAGEFGIKANSENIALAGFNLGAMDMTAQLKDRILVVPKFQFMPYDGNLNMQGKIDFASAYNLDMDLSNVNLKKLINDTPLKNNEIWGTLSAKSSLEGKGTDLSTIKGAGWIMVANGHLWEFPLLGGIAEALNLPRLKKIEIKEAAGNFTIADRKIDTQNLQFSSPQFNMLARGNMGFDGTLDFNVGLSFTPGFAQENEFAKLAALIIDETGRFIGQVGVSGTVKQPKYIFIPLHLDKLIKNQVVEGLKKIFNPK